MIIYFSVFNSVGVAAGYSFKCMFLPITVQCTVCDRWNIQTV